MRSARTRATHALARAFRWLAIAALVLELLYLVAANLFLSTSLFGDAVNVAPEAIDVHFARAWSLFPTHVQARGVEIRGADSSVQWMLHIDEVTFDCSLYELAKQRFHVTAAHGSGISYRIRTNVETPAATAAATRYVPPIDGLGPIGLVPDEPPFAGEWSDADWHLWTIHLENVVADHVSDIWWNGARFRGDARVTGGFYLRPVRDVRVGPLEVAIRSGEISLDDEVVASPVALTATGRIAEFDPRVTKGTDLLHRVSLIVDGIATVPDVGRTALGRWRGVALRGEANVTALTLRLEDGVAGDGSEVRIAIPSLTLAGDPFEAEGAVTISAQVVEKRFAASVEISGAELEQVIVVPEARVTADARALDLADPLTDLHVALHVPRADVADARSLGRYLASPGVAILGGALHGEGRAEAWRANRRVSGEVTVQAARLAVRIEAKGATEVDPKGDLTEGDFTLHAVGKSGEGTGRVNLTGTSLALRNVGVRGALVEDGWSGDVSLDDAELSLDGAPRFSTNVALEARDATPLLAAAFRDGVPEVVREISLMPHLSARGRIEVGARRLVASNLRAIGGNLDVKGVYVARDHDGRGAAIVKKGPLSVGIALGAGGARVHLFGLDAWFRDQVEAADLRAAL